MMAPSLSNYSGDTDPATDDNNDGDNVPNRNSRRLAGGGVRR